MTQMENNFLRKNLGHFQVVLVLLIMKGLLYLLHSGTLLGNK